MALADTPAGVPLATVHSAPQAGLAAILLDTEAGAEEAARQAFVGMRALGAQYHTVIAFVRAHHVLVSTRRMRPVSRAWAMACLRSRALLRRASMAKRSVSMSERT